MSRTKSLSYVDAGVDIDAGDALVENIKPFVTKTHSAAVLTGLGGFGGLFALPTGYREPVLVASTDGVGTKLKLAIALGQHDTVGIDLVAMCVNDVLAQGAKPLFFLDYYATGQLSVATATEVIRGIAAGCKLADMALIGGETAEMPGMYGAQDYDLAGFCVGIAEKSALLSPEKIQVGDALIALASSGIHSNGYSLVRKIINDDNIDLASPFDGTSLGKAVLTPTKIYVQPILALLNKCQVHGIAHITGGGLLENIPRILPENTAAKLLKNSWELPPIFAWLQVHGNIAEQEMWRTFNCGVGMVIAVPAAQTQAAIAVLTAQGETAWQIGSVVRHRGESVVEMSDE